MECDQILTLLEHLDISELKELVNDEDAFSNFTKDAASNLSKDSTEKIQMLMVSNKSLAEYNLNQEEELIDKKTQFQDINDQVEEITKSIEEKVNLIKSHKNNVSPDTVLALLQTAASETEEESEKIAEQFLNGTIDVDKFLDTFTTKRIEMHHRRTKADKMTEMLTKRSSFSAPSHNISNGHNSSYGGLPKYPPLSIPGYPMSGGPNMPLPSMPLAPYPQLPSMPKPYF